MLPARTWIGSEDKVPAEQVALKDFLGFNTLRFVNGEEDCCFNIHYLQFVSVFFSIGYTQFEAFPTRNVYRNARF